jgi:hypothetical protein
MQTREIEWDGRIALPSDLEAIGYRPGVVVRVSVLSTGSLLVAIDDTPVLDLPFQPLTGWAARKALRDRRAP